MSGGRARRGLIVAGAAAAGTAIGVAALRRAARDLRAHEHEPEWAELHRPLGGATRQVESFDGTLLHAEVSGPTGAPTLVLAHGYVLSMDAWHYQRRDLADTYRVVAYDQRGHGRSEQAASGDYSIGALGRDLQAVLDAVVPQGERAIAVGHSMGGMSVLSYADQYPEEVDDRLAGAVLVDTTAADVIRGSVFGGGSALAAQALGGLAARIVALRPPERLRFNDLALLFTRGVGLSSSASAAHVAFTIQLALSCPRSVSAALVPALTSLDVREAAERLDVPVLVLVGEEDRVTPMAASKELAAVLRWGELVVLPGVGHMAPLEAHREVTAHIRAFAGRAFAQAAA